MQGLNFGRSACIATDCSYSEGRQMPGAVEIAQAIVSLQVHNANTEATRKRKHDTLDVLRSNGEGGVLGNSEAGPAQKRRRGAVDDSSRLHNKLELRKLFFKSI